MTAGQASFRGTCQEAAPARLRRMHPSCARTVQGTAVGDRACPGLAQPAVALSPCPGAREARTEAEPLEKSRTGDAEGQRSRGRRGLSARTLPARPAPHFASPPGPGKARRSARAQGRPGHRAPAPRRSYLGRRRRRRLLQLLPAEPTGRRGGAGRGGSSAAATWGGRRRRSRRKPGPAGRAAAANIWGGGKPCCRRAPRPPPRSIRQSGEKRAQLRHRLVSLSSARPCERGCWERRCRCGGGEARGSGMPFRG